ncbi:MAG: NAD(P)H-dependent oxidoreductase [Pseudomonadota bacterium]
MDVLAINGSARADKGVTGRLLAALTAGLAQGGAQVETLHAAALKVAPCAACLSCMLKTPGRCAQDDDMERVCAGLRQARLLVLAAPVYTDGYPAPLKAVLDRMICAMQPFLAPDAFGRLRHPLWWKMPRDFLLVSTCGFPETATFAPLVATFRAQARNFNARPLAELCVPGSIALQMEPAALEPHLALITQAGELVAREGELPPGLLAAINRPPLSVDRYLEIGERYQELCRRRLNKAQARA